MSLCLQSIVDEIVRVKNGRPVKKVGNLMLLFKGETIPQREGWFGKILITKIGLDRNFLIM